jgi:ubiquinone/menaquinone biosynthesis C-methylase UbiE
VKREIIPELLDSDSGTPEEIRAALGDLCHINQWFGGIGTTLSMVEYVAKQIPAQSLSLLEVAAGTGFVPHTVSQRLETRDIDLQVMLLDRAHSHLAQACVAKGSRNGGPRVVGDALSLPFDDGSFDLVSCCLFAHHLSPLQLIQFIDEGLRVCRHAVLVNDLVRHPVHLALVYAGLPLFRSRITHHDALASVRQAYTLAEMEETLKRTQASRLELQRHYLFRMGVIAWKKP